MMHCMLRVVIRAKFTLLTAPSKFQALNPFEHVENSMMGLAFKNMICWPLPTCLSLLVPNGAMLYHPVTLLT